MPIVRRPTAVTPSTTTTTPTTTTTTTTSKTTTTTPTRYNRHRRGRWTKIDRFLVLCILILVGIAIHELRIIITTNTNNNTNNSNFFRITTQQPKLFPLQIRLVPSESDVAADADADAGAGADAAPSFTYQHIQQVPSFRLSHYQPPGQVYTILDNENNDESDEDTQKERPECVNLGDWQTTSFPNCNVAHEIGTQQGNHHMELINCGGDRCAFRLHDDGILIDNLHHQHHHNNNDYTNINNNNDYNMVLKIPRFDRDYDEYAYFKANKDGVAMERLSFSDYILDIYGYCGLSQVIELGSPQGNLHDLIKTTRLHSRSSIPVLDQLKISYHIVSAVADMHQDREQLQLVQSQQQQQQKQQQQQQTKDSKIVPIVHNDICCHQFIHVNGIYKLNDFHLAKFQQRNQHTNETCPARNHYSKKFILIRSPEEMVSRYPRISLEKSDVYTMGNILYYTLTMGFLYPQLESVSEAVDKTRRGERSPFPPSMIDSQDPAIQAMVHAIQWSWTHDPEERPRAVEVKNYLQQRVASILLNQTTPTEAAAATITRPLALDDVRVHTIEPLPPDHRYTDSDFNIMFKSEKRRKHLETQRNREENEQSKLGRKRSS